MSGPGNGNGGPPVSPKGGLVAVRKAGRFTGVADLLRGGNPAGAFNRAAELCLDKFEVLAKTMPPAVVLKLAIEMHKHALFCEVAADKARSRHDTAAYDAYQKYLSGETDMPVAMGLPLGTVKAPTVDVEIDVEGETDGQE